MNSDNSYSIPLGDSRNNFEFRNRFNQHKNDTGGWVKNLDPNNFKMPEIQIPDSVAQYIPYYRKNKKNDDKLAICYALGLMLIGIGIVLFATRGNATQIVTESDSVILDAVADVAPVSEHSNQIDTKGQQVDVTMIENSLISVPTNLAHHQDGIPQKHESLWYQLFSHHRPADAISPLFDGIAVSLILNYGHHYTLAPFQNSIGTFLKQVRDLQISTNDQSTKFVGSKLISTENFKVTIPKLSQLEIYFNSLQQFAKNFPEDDWYIQTDEDTFIFMENLRQVLETFKSESPLIIHNLDLPPEGTSTESTKNDGHFPITIFSRAAMKIIEQQDISKCLMKYEYLTDLSSILFKCLSKWGIRPIAESTLHDSSPSDDFAWPADPCEEPLSVSRLTERQMQHMYNLQPTVNKCSNGNPLKWHAKTNYGDLFTYFFNGVTSTPGIDRHSASTDFIVKKSGAECLRFCVDHHSCVSWTFTDKKCYFSDNLGIAIPSSEVVSGVLSARYRCDPKSELEQ
ncbi:hypothetical protein BC833DRAFT_623471 [Globomyces pollinis-pini]|nr:hypothetical protein BC833DRAFT_623471 [Globomyces pollinis-pini]